MLPPRGLFARNFAIVEMNPLRAQDLVIFVAFPGDQHDVSRGCRSKRQTDRPASIGLHQLGPAHFRFSMFAFGFFDLRVVG